VQLSTPALRSLEDGVAVVIEDLVLPALR
jgi:hypothetical protein